MAKQMVQIFSQNKYIGETSMMNDECRHFSMAPYCIAKAALAASEIASLGLHEDDEINIVVNEG